MTLAKNHPYISGVNNVKTIPKRNKNGMLRLNPFQIGAIKQRQPRTSLPTRKIVFSKKNMEKMATFKFLFNTFEQKKN